jgi:hypothetical protein
MASLPLLLKGSNSVAVVLVAVDMMLSEDIGCQLADFSSRCLDRKLAIEDNIVDVV